MKKQNLETIRTVFLTHIMIACVRNSTKPTILWTILNG